MKKHITLWLAALLIVATLTACGAPGGTPSGSTSSGHTEGTPIESLYIDTSATAEVPPKVEADMFTDRDRRTEYDASKSILIELRGTTAAASAAGVKIDGSTVTITEEATYIVRGTLEDGQLIVNAPDTAKLQIVLEGAAITSADSAALYILQADKVFLTLVGENSLANGGAFTVIDENNIDGAIYSKQDLSLNGDGSLTVTSPAGHGIVCKDDLVLCGGTYEINAASHALDANDSIRLDDVTLTAKAGKDGLHAEHNEDASLGFVYMASGTLDITAEGDGISAGSTLQIENGNITILAGGGYQNGAQQSSSGWGGFPGGGSMGGWSGGGKPDGGKPGGRATSQSDSTESDDASTSMKGLKSGSDMLLTDGTYHIDAADDTLHANTSLTVNGGTFTLASGDDAIHAEERLTLTAGRIDISTSYEGLEALHIEVAGGDIKLVASDDGLNAAGGTDQSGMGGRDNMFGDFGGFGGGFGGNSNGSIVISGGTLYVNASGDGIDANGTLEISGGHTTVVGPTSGDTSTLDYDKTATITGGTFIGTGSTMMSQSFSSASQGVIDVRVNGTTAAGTQITLTDKEGNVLLTHAPEHSFQRILLTMPEIKSGESYTLTVGTQTTSCTAK